MVVKDNDDNIDYLFNKATAIILKKHREKANMSLEEVVQRMNSSITRQSLFKYENNLARIKNSTFIDICIALKIDPEDTFNEIKDYFLKMIKED